MKKRVNKIHQCAIPGAKIQCSIFGNNFTTMYATGDDHNNIGIWSFRYDKALAVYFDNKILNTSTNYAQKVQVSALSFSNNDKDVISGSNRGIINIWDLHSKKVKNTLKGHAVSVNSFAIYPQNQNLLVSGSCDTNIKIWDLRSKQSIAVLKNHSMQINVLQVSPDQSFLISGSQDSYIKLWQLRMYKTIHSYGNHQAPINCLKFNPQQMVFASGGNDRTAKLWQMDGNYACLNSTKPDATPITAIAYSPDGKYIFTASNESLKLWNFSMNETILADNIETGWKNVQDMIISDNQLVGTSCTATSFAVYGCPLNRISFDGKKVRVGSQKRQIYEVRKNYKEEYQSPQKLKNVQKTQSNQEKDFNLDVKAQKKKVDNNVIQGMKNIQMDIPKFEQEKIRQPPLLRRSQSTQSEQNQDTIIGSDIMAETIQFSNFFQQNSKKNIYKQIDIISEIEKDHQKWSQILTTRIRHTKPILTWWKNGNLNQALIALRQVENISVSSDVMEKIFDQEKEKVKQLPVDAGILLTEKCRPLIQSKHMTYIKNGLKYMQTIVNIYKDEIIRIKSYDYINNKVDLAREQRLKKFDLLFDEFYKVFKMSRLKKLIEKQKKSQSVQQVYVFNQSSVMASRLLDDLTYILRKCVPKNQSEFA